MLVCERKMKVVKLKCDKRKERGKMMRQESLILSKQQGDTETLISYRRETGGLEQGPRAPG